MSFYNLLWLVFIIKLTASKTITTSPAILTDCDSDTHYFNCGNGQYITITQATYIKKDTQAVCPYDIYTGTRHSQDVTSHAVSSTPCARFGDPCFGYSKELVVSFKCENSSVWVEDGGIEITQENSSISISDSYESKYHYYCTGGRVARIAQAVYGKEYGSNTCRSGPGSIDVTKQIQETYCSTHSCFFEALNDKFGDPCLWVPKQLNLTFQCEDQSGRLTVAGKQLNPTESNLEQHMVEIGPLGLSIVIPDSDQSYHYFYCPVTQVIQVTSATYGNSEAKCNPDANTTTTARGVMNATAQIQSGCSSRLCKVKSPYGSYGDPCHGEPKNLTASFTCLLNSPIAGIGNTTTVTVDDADSDWHYYYCPHGEAVRVVSAQYGNSTANCTANTNSAVLGGYMNVTSYIQSMCSGWECYFRAPNGTYGDPCIGNNKQLIVNLECFPEVGLSLQTETILEARLFRWDTKIYHYSCPPGSLIEILIAEYFNANGVSPCSADVTSSLTSSCYAEDCYLSFHSAALNETDCGKEICQLVATFKDCVPA